MHYFSPEASHEYLLNTVPKTLAFDAGRHFGDWSAALDRTLRELVGPMSEPILPQIVIEYEQEHETHREIRFVFHAEEYVDVPCHLLIPTQGTGPYPVVICLQGHSTGMHISLGKPKYENDEKSIAGGRDFGLQAVREGYAALVLEQRCFGERKDQRPQEVRGIAHPCIFASVTALLLGRTMVGERVGDISRAIDALSCFPEVDATRVGCMGNSGGGTVTYYAACLDPRISIAMPSCSVCTYAGSIARIDHCPDQYLPRALNYFEMPDLAGLIAPRPLIVVTGATDPIFPLDEVRGAFATIQAIYTAAGVPDQCRLIIGSEGHRFYPEESWPVFREMSGWAQPATTG